MIVVCHERLEHLWGQHGGSSGVFKTLLVCLFQTTCGPSGQKTTVPQTKEEHHSTEDGMNRHIVFITIFAEYLPHQMR